MSSLRVYYLKDGNENSIRLELEDEAMAGDVLREMLKQFSGSYSHDVKPISMGSSIAISTILMLTAAGLTAFLIWGAQEVASGQAGSTGSIRTKAIINLLEMLGTTGTTIIGVVLLLIALGISAFLMLKPPSVKEITLLQDMEG
jgi:hypothetical protein